MVRALGYKMGRYASALNVPSLRDRNVGVQKYRKCLLCRMEFLSPDAAVRYCSEQCRKKTRNGYPRVKLGGLESGCIMDNPDRDRDFLV